MDMLVFRTLLWIRIGFMAEPDSAFYDTDPDSVSKTNADPDRGQSFPLPKNRFNTKYTLLIVIVNSS